MATAPQLESFIESDTQPSLDVARSVLLFELPPAIRANDTHCRTAVARLLQHPPVRSVTVDRYRHRAVVRVKPRHDLHAHREALHAALHGESSSPDATDALTMPLVSWTDAASQSTCYIKLPTPAHGWRKAFLMLAAGVTLGLGLLGVLLPGLPTTPFVLLASICLLRSSPRLHERLLMSRLFGGVLRDWHLHRGVRPHVRYKAMFVIALVVAASTLLTSIPIAVKLAIAAVAGCGVAYVWRLPNVVEHLPDDPHVSCKNVPPN